VSSVRRNVEIKARCPDPALLRTLALLAGAEFSGEEEQTDTYFRTQRGRFKLRRVRGGRAELVRYERTDALGPRTSAYSVKKVRRPWLVRFLLAVRHGISVEVAKRREVWLWRGVRIHLDEVRHLGTFVELEAVVDDIGDPDEAERRCRQLMEMLAIRNEDLVDRSYSDLLMENSRGG
jgi:adenylate cyclase class 2